MSNGRTVGGVAAGRTVARRQAGPTPVRMLVGAQLRRLREACGISRAAAGEAIRASASKISRLEQGRAGFKQRDVADLLALYGVHDAADRQAMLDLVKQDTMPGWWTDYADVVPSRFEPFLGLELAASVIRCYEVQVLPGLLQTEDYARAVIRLAHHGDSDARIQRRTSLRMHRQRILARPDPPQLWAVIDETALRNAFGGEPSIHQAQLEHLLEVIELPHVTVQVIPLGTVGDIELGEPITILRFPQDQLADIVYVRHLTRALYLDKATEVARYWDLMNRLSLYAESAAATESFVRRALKEI
jgi:transcriptional regulator with XRE-family HTH domain